MKTNTNKKTQTFTELLPEKKMVMDTYLFMNVHFDFRGFTRSLESPLLCSLDQLLCVSISFHWKYDKDDTNWKFELKVFMVFSLKDVYELLTKCTIFF